MICFSRRWENHGRLSDRGQMNHLIKQRVIGSDNELTRYGLSNNAVHSHFVHFVSTTPETLHRPFCFGKFVEHRALSHSDSRPHKNHELDE